MIFHGERCDWLKHHKHYLTCIRICVRHTVVLARTDSGELGNAVPVVLMLQDEDLPLAD